jgi:hypothetical protein
MPYLDTANQALPFQAGSDTSHDAAVEAQAFAGTQQARYLAWLTSKGAHGGTDAEAEAELGMRRQSICARRGELMKRGAVGPRGWTYGDTDRPHDAHVRRGGCAVWRAV